MNRELKFMAWHSEQKRMFKVHALGKDWLTEETMDGIDIGNNCFGIDCGIEYIKVMQFTGFKLKNDVEIYDGYILGDWADVDGKMIQSRVPVFFDEITGQWMLDMSSMKDRSYSVSLFSDLQEYDYELLGNIYENPL